MLHHYVNHANIFKNGTIKIKASGQPAYYFEGWSWDLAGRVKCMKTQWLNHFLDNGIGLYTEVII
jgi:hypothetical protein